MWECGTLEHPVGSQVRSLFCWESERKALKARIARLEETLRGGEKVIAKLSYNRTERTFKSTKP